MTVVIILGVEGLRREARKKQIEAAIVEQAIALFKKKGYDRVTVEEITNQSGIAKGTFFNYFRKKEDVLLHLANSHMELLSQIAETHQGKPVKERLAYIYRDLLKIYFQHADLMRLTLVETLRASIGFKETASNLSLFQGTLQTVIREAQQNGELPSRWDAGMIASMVGGLFINALITGSSTMDEGQIFALLCSQLEAVWEGVANA